MRHFLLAVLLAATTPALAQTVPPVGTEAAQPFKKANTIVIHTTDSTGLAYKKIAQAILEAGYTIDRADKELGFINTKAKTLAKSGTQNTVQANIKRVGAETLVELRGAFSMPAMAAMYAVMAGDTPTQYRGMKGSPIMSSWDEMMRVATLYRGDALGFKQQP
jgi:hypothetical protein